MESVLFKPEFLFTEGKFRSDLGLAVSADGRISKLSPVSPTARAVHLPGRVLLPGQVNAHSHAFQRLLRGRTEFRVSGPQVETFWTWRERMYQIASALGPEELYLASRLAFLEMAMSGITTVGEFHYLHRDPDGREYADPNELAKTVVRAARDVGLRIVLLRVGYARAGHRQPEDPRQRRFIEPDVEKFIRAADELGAAFRADPYTSVGIAPHSVRAVPRSWLERSSELRHRVVHMHVAEQPGEVDTCLGEYGRRPVELLDEVGLLGPRFTAVHAIHVSEGEIELLGRSGSAVCACPSTERNLGDGVVPADELIAAGVPISLGSDSQAEIDLMDEATLLEGHLRLVRRKRAVLDFVGGDPNSLAARLFTCATANGARALGLDDGELRVGAPADFFTVDLGHPSLVGTTEDNLLEAIVFGMERGAVRDVAVGGELIVQDREHLLGIQSEREFAALCRKVFS
jgi:formimidoylglutamate deiminase